MEKQFVFVVGCPRSGTSWLHQMIAAHNEICTLDGSNTFLHHYIMPMQNQYDKERRQFADKGFTRGVPTKLLEHEWHALINKFIADFYSILPENQIVYVEKTTDIKADLIRLKGLVPKAKFIHIIRDGRNSTVSRVKYRQIHGKPFGVSDPHEGAVMWKNQIMKIRRAGETMGQESYMEIKYESLVQNTFDEMVRAFSFIGVQTNSIEVWDICHSFHYGRKPVSNPTSDIMTPDGFPVTPYKPFFSFFDLLVFECVAGNVLRDCGYKSDYSLYKAKMLFASRFLLRLPGFIRFYKRVHNKVRRLGARLTITPASM